MLNQIIRQHFFGRLKKAKEDLEQFLLENDRMMSTTKYYKCEELFGNLEIWRAVGDSDRRDIYEDVIFNLAKREKEEAKQLKKRNTKRLAQVLDTMTEVTYRTTWQEAQALLLQHPAFAEDADLLEMDKEDALIVFEQCLVYIILYECYNVSNDFTSFICIICAEAFETRLNNGFG